MDNLTFNNKHGSISDLQKASQYPLDNYVDLRLKITIWLSHCVHLRLSLILPDFCAKVLPMKVPC